MDKLLLQKHLKSFLNKLRHEPEKHRKDYQERNAYIIYYQSKTKNKILDITQDDLLVITQKRVK